MFRMRKSYAKSLFWLATSELLCLVLAFSFAILPQLWARWSGLICCLLAHILMLGSCAGSVADEDIAVYRREKREPSIFSPVLLGFLTALPRFLLGGLLWLHADSNLMLNLYLLLNAPYIQIHRQLLNGAEPFSAVSSFRRILICLMPSFTVLSVFVGYRLRYTRKLREERAKRKTASS